VATFIPSSSAICFRMRRLVALSSTMRAVTPANETLGTAFVSAVLLAMAASKVKWKQLPAPGSLSTQMRPPINSRILVEMVSPNPVPPNFRVVSELAWENASKMVFCFSSGMPIPVSPGCSEVTLLLRTLAPWTPSVMKTDCPQCASTTPWIRTRWSGPVPGTYPNTSLTFVMGSENGSARAG